jgi:hypothetical protein
MKIKTNNFEEIHLTYTFKARKVWKLNKNIKLKLSNGDTAILPKGFRTDFASVPKFLWGLLPPYGTDIMAFLIHDYLYDFGYYIDLWGEEKQVDKKFADNEMKWQQRKVGIRSGRLYPMFWAVRLFGRYRNLWR